MRDAVDDPGGEASLNGVSCASTSFCTAVGSVIVPGQGWGATLTEVWDGASWSLVPSPDLAAGDLGPGEVGGGSLTAVSCASAQACVSCVHGEAGTACAIVGQQSSSERSSSALAMTTSAAVGSLPPTSTQLSVSTGGRLTARVSLAGPEPSVGSRYQSTTDGAVRPRLGGTITFLDGGVPMASCPPTRLGHAAEVSCRPSTLSGTLTAAYSGSSAFAGSSAEASAPRAGRQPSLAFRSAASKASRTLATHVPV